MKQTERTYPFGKSMMLNVIYDTLERLGISVNSINSEYGIINIQRYESKLIIKIDTVYPQENSRVTIMSQDESLSSDLTNVLFDEITSTISATKANH